MRIVWWCSGGVARVIAEAHEEGRLPCHLGVRMMKPCRRVLTEYLVPFVLECEQVFVYSAREHDGEAKDHIGY